MTQNSKQSQVLYNLQSQNFRLKHFVKNFKINHVLELSSIRKEIFGKVKVPVSILFYQPSNDIEISKNTIQYISIKPSPFFSKFKMFIISKNDYKTISQIKLLQYDYLWKVLVYGSYLDFNLIKRLKTQYQSINQMALKNNYTTGMGVQATKGNADISHYLNKDFIDIPRGKDAEKYFSRFYIADSLPKWDIQHVHRRGEKELFKPYSVLITRGVDLKTLKAKSAILNKEAIFKHTLTGINIPNENIAKNFAGLINSSLFAYYNLQVASSIGIEREQLHDEEKLETPFIEDNQIVSLVSKIMTLKHEHLDTQSKNIFTYENNLQYLTQKLDNIILKLFMFNEIEYALIDYATRITIPWVINKEGSRQLNEV